MLLIHTVKCPYHIKSSDGFNKQKKTVTMRQPKEISVLFRQRILIINYKLKAQPFGFPNISISSVAS